MDLKDIGRKIREKRIAKSWKQEDLAEKTSLSVSYIGMIERGEKLPKLETFLLIVNELEVSADELLSGVIRNGYIVRMSQYTEKIGKLKSDEQKRIYEVIETLLRNS